MRNNNRQHVRKKVFEVPVAISIAVMFQKTRRFSFYNTKPVLNFIALYS